MYYLTFDNLSEFAILGGLFIVTRLINGNSKDAFYWASLIYFSVWALMDVFLVVSGFHNRAYLSFQAQQPFIFLGALFVITLLIKRNFKDAFCWASVAYFSVGALLIVALATSELFVSEEAKKSRRIKDAANELFQRVEARR